MHTPLHPTPTLLRQNGSIDALIHSKVMLNYRGVMAGDCTVKIVGDPFDLWEQAFAINAALNTSGLVDAMDAALQPMYQSGAWGWCQRGGRVAAWPLRRGGQRGRASLRP